VLEIEPNHKQASEFRRAAKTELETLVGR
jgi:hypothetical protein